MRFRQIRTHRCRYTHAEVVALDAARRQGIVARRISGRQQDSSSEETKQGTPFTDRGGGAILLWKITEKEQTHPDLK
jgi:hypothetical protein